MRHAVSLLLLACAVSADDIYPRQGQMALESDVMIVDEEGSKIRYVDKSLKERAMAKSMVGRVVKMRSTVHEFYERYEAADTAGKVMALIEWAKGKRFHKRIYPDLYQRALQFDGSNEAANLALGNVQYRGEWMTPDERERRTHADAEEAKRAEGLVRWKDRWVTPEDRAKLEQGLVKHEGRWMTPDDAKRAQGLVKYEGKWIRKADLEIVKLIDPAREETGLGDRLQVFQSANYAVLGDLPPAQLQIIGEAMERLFAEWLRIFPDDRGSDILEGKHRVFVFKKPRPYQGWVRGRYQRQKRAEGWSTAFAKAEEIRMKLRLRETSFWEVQPTVVSGHVQMPDPFEGLKAHCVHFGANILVTRHHRIRFPTWWLNEGLSYYLEKRVTGDIQTYNVDVGSAGYADQGAIEQTNKNNPWLDSAQWKKMLGALVREGRDPKLARMKSKVLYGSKNRLDAKDLAKSFSVVTYLITSDAGKFAEFMRDCKGGSGSAVEREVAAVIKHYGSYARLESAWKQYALNGFRLAR